MSRTFTHKPCPGCGLNKELAPQTICHDCQDKIRTADRLKGFAAMASDGRVLAVDRVALPRSITDLPSAERFHRDLLALMAELCPPGDPKKSTNTLRFRYDGGAVDEMCGVIEPPRCFLVAGDEVNVKFVQFYTSINLLIHEAMAKGQLKGQNFLAQLASGELSMTDLNRRTADAESRLRG